MGVNTVDVNSLRYSSDCLLVLPQFCLLPCSQFSAIVPQRNIPRLETF